MPVRINPPLPTRTRNHARELRQGGTDAEQKLWQRLRAAQLSGLKFRRQHPFPPYIVDFYCDAKKLVVELDGSQHNDEVDRVRTSFLESQGLKVLRYWDNEVLQQVDAVLEAILSAVGTRTLTPTPLPMGEGSKANSDECDTAPWLPIRLWQRIRQRSDRWDSSARAELAAASRARPVRRAVVRHSVYGAAPQQSAQLAISDSSSCGASAFPAVGAYGLPQSLR